MTEVGKVTVRAEIDSSKVAGQLGSLKGQVNSAAGEMESSFSKLGGALKTGLLAAGAGAAGLATAGLVSYKNLEEAASHAASKAVDVYGKSATEISAQYDVLLKHVQDVSSEVGAATVFSDVEVAKTFDALAAGGVNIAKVGRNELVPFMNLASATGEQLTDVTDLLTGSMSSFGYGMEDSAVIADQLAMAMNGSKASMGTLNFALRQGGSAASATGMELSEFSAIVGVLADKNYTGEQSGAALKTAMLALYNPTKVQAETLEKLGITYDQVDPRANDFRDTLSLLLSKGADIGDFGQIFTDSSGSIMHALAGESGAVDSLLQKIEGSSGLSQVQADLMMRTDKLVGAWEIAKGAAESLSNSIGAYLEPAAVKLLNTWTELAPKLKEFGGAVADGDWDKVGDMMSKGIKAGWDKLKDLGKDLYNKIKAVNWSGLGAHVTKGIKTAWDGLNSLGGQLLGQLKAVDWSSIGSSVAAGLVGIGQWLYDAIAGIDWGGLVSLVVGYLSALKDYYLGIGKGLYDALVAVDWGSIGKKVLDSLKNIGSEIAKIFSGINFGDIGKGILDSLSGIGDKVLGFFESVPWASVGKWLADGIKNGIQSLTGIANTVADLFKKHSWDGVGTDIGNKIKTAIGNVSGWLDKAIDGAKSSVAGWGDIGTKAGEAIKNALGAIKDYAKSVYDNIKSGIQSWIDSKGPSQLGALVMDAIAIGLAGSKAVFDAVIGIFTWENFKGLLSWIDLGAQCIAEFATGFLAEGIGIGGQLASGVMRGFADAIKSSGIPYADEMAAKIYGAADYVRDSTYSLKTAQVGGRTTGLDYINPTAVKAAEAARSVDAEGNVYEYGKLTGNIFQAEEEQGRKIAEEEKKIRIATAQQEAAVITDALKAPALSYGAIQTLFEQKYGAGGKPWVWEAPTVAAKPSATISTTSGTPEPISRIEGYGSVSGALAVAKQLASAGYTLEEVNAKLYEWAQNSKGLLPSGADIKKGYAEGAEIWKAGGKEAALISARVNYESTQASAAFIQQMLAEGKIVFQDGTWKWKDGVAETVKTANAAALANANTATQAANTAAATTTAAAVPVQEAALSFREQIWKAVSDTDQMFRAGGEAVRFGLNAEGQKIAIIGQVAQQQFQAAGGKWVSDVALSGATLGAKISTSGSGLQTNLQVGANSIGSALQNGASALNGAASSIGSMVGAVTGRAFSSIFGGSASPGSGSSSGGWPAGSGLAGWGGKPKGMASGGETSGPQMALIGEAGKEFVIPTRNKRWDLLLAAMRSYGIKTFAEGGAAGSGGGSEATDADEMRAYFGISGLASMSKQVQKIINNLKDFFRISWGIIRAEGSVYWRQINQIITAEATLTRDAAWQAAIDIRNTWLSTNAQILADATTNYAAMWPAIEPSISSLKSSLVSSFTDAGNGVILAIQQMVQGGESALSAFAANWQQTWATMLTDLSNAQSQISSAISSIAAELARINVNVNISGGGYGGGSGGGSGGSGGTDGVFGGWLDPTGDWSDMGGSTYNVNTGGGGCAIGTNCASGGCPDYKTAVIASTGPLATAGLGYTGGAASSYTSSGYSLPAVFRARGGLVEKPELAVIGEEGPELIMPTKMTRMFMALDDAGVGQVSGGAGSAKIVIEDHTVHEHYWNGRKVMDLVMTEAKNRMQLRGAISTR